MARSSRRQVRRPSSVTTSKGPRVTRVQRRAVWASWRLRRGQALVQQTPLAQAHADEEERDRELVGQPLEMVGHLSTIAPVEVQEVDVVDDDEAGLARQHAVGGPVGELGGVAPLGSGMGVEATEHGVEAAHRGVGGQADVGHRDPLVAVGGGGAVEVDLAAVESGGEDHGQGRLAQPGVGVEQGRALHLVAVLAVGLHHFVEVGQQLLHLGGEDGAQVGVPDTAGLFVASSFGAAKAAQLGATEISRPGPGRGLDATEPALLERQRVVLFKVFDDAHVTLPKASS